MWVALPLCTCVLGSEVRVPRAPSEGTSSQALTTMMEEAAPRAGLGRTAQTPADNGCQRLPASHQLSGWRETAPRK